MMSRALVTVLFVLYVIDVSSAFAISPESVALQTAALGSKISDIRETVAEVTHEVGEAVQDKVNYAVDTVNHVSASATATLNHGLVSAQNAVHGAVSATRDVVSNAVQTTQNAVSGAVQTTQNVVNGAVQTTQNAVSGAIQTTQNVVNGAVVATALQTAADVVLAPVRLVTDHVQNKFVMVSNRLYQLVHPNLDQEVVYVPVSPSTYVSPGVVVPTNHRVTYTEVVHPYVYKSGGVDEYLVSGSENVENIVVPEETPKEGEHNQTKDITIHKDKESSHLQTVENGASLPHFEYPDVTLPPKPIYEVDPKTGLIQFNHPAYSSLSQKSSTQILPYDEREIDVTGVVRKKRVTNTMQFFR